jgi:hypothetical protein
MPLSTMQQHEDWETDRPFMGNERVHFMAKKIRARKPIRMSLIR